MTECAFCQKSAHGGQHAFRLLERSPSTATAEDIRRFQIHQSERGMNAPAMNSALAALRFFFNHTADRPDLSRKLIHYDRIKRAVLREWKGARGRMSM